MTNYTTIFASQGDTKNTRKDEMAEMLEFYGYVSLEEYANDKGLSRKDAERLLRELWDEDHAPFRN